jgi:hypothetical protein
MNPSLLPPELLELIHQDYDAGIKISEIVSKHNLQKFNIIPSTLHTVIVPIQSPKICPYCNISMVFPRRNREPENSYNNRPRCPQCKHRISSAMHYNDCSCDHCRQAERRRYQEARTKKNATTSIKKDSKEPVKNLRIPVVLELTATEIEEIISFFKAANPNVFGRYIESLETAWNLAKLVAQNSIGNFGTCKYCKKSVFWLNNRAYNVNENGKAQKEYHHCEEYRYWKNTHT